MTNASQPPSKRVPGRPAEPLTWEKFQAICTTLGVNGLKRKACELNGYSWDVVNARIARELAAGNTAWQEAWDGAMEDYREVLKAEAHRRAVEGVERPVFGALGKGLGTGVVGHVTEYSDALLISKLKAHVPEFGPRLDVTVTPGAGPGGERPDLFAGLTSAAKRAIREIIVKDLEAQRLARATEVAVVDQQALPAPEETEDD